MLKLLMIRHGMTEGNRLKRYIGTTDEPLCEDGRLLLLQKKYEPCEKLFVSPLLRCRETAGILFPGCEQTVIDELAECDFGDFENKNYMELAGDPDYQAWIDSNGELPFPNGESREECSDRYFRGLKKAMDICETEQIERAAMVVHGGTIMNLMDICGVPKRSFYEWHVDNGCGIMVLPITEEGHILLKFVSAV